MSAPPPISEAPIDALTGEVELTHADLAQALAKLPLFRRRWLYLGAAALLVVVLLVSHASLTSLMPFVLFTLVFQAYLFLGPRLMARRSLAAMPDRTVRYRADARELAVTTTGSTVIRSWDRIARFSEEPGAFLIWIGPYAVQVIPKRAFDAEGVAWLRTTLGREIRPSPKSARRRVILIALWAVLVLVFLAVWQLLDQGSPSVEVPAPDSHEH